MEANDNIEAWRLVPSLPEYMVSTAGQPLDDDEIWF